MSEFLKYLYSGKMARTNEKTFRRELCATSSELRTHATYMHFN
jgi:hypothetical protein